MALLTITTLKDAIQDEIPNKGSPEIIRAVNMVIRRIYTEFTEPLETTFTTVPAVSTGTVAVTQDSTAATFSSGLITTSDPPRFVQIQGDNAWFPLTRGATDNDGVLSSKWASANNASATFTIVYPVIPFGADVGEIISIGQTGFDPLRFRVGTRDVQTTWWWQMGVGLPTHYGYYQHKESSGSEYLQILLSPAPQDRRVYAVTYKPRFTYLDPAGLDTQTVPLQDRWHEAVIQGVLFFVWKQESKSEKAVLQNTVYEAALSRARGASNPAGVIAPKRRVGGMWVYEQRPIG